MQSVRFGGANGTEGKLSYLSDRGKLVWNGPDSVLVVDFADISFIDDTDENERMELIVCSRKNGELRFDFGSKIRAFIEFEKGLQIAIDQHTAATPQAGEGHELERTLKHASADT